MLDSHLAQLYGVPTKRLNEQVRRNLRRFPEDFMFRLDPKEAEDMRSKIATASRRNARHQPFAFTEHGVAMLSSVLNSQRAVDVNIAIMRAFVQLRRTLAASPDLADRLRQAEQRLSAHEATLGEHGQAIREVFADIRALIKPPVHVGRLRRRARRAKPNVLKVVATLQR